MIFLGIDPGSEKCGFAVIQIKNQKPEILEMGVWQLKTQVRKSLGSRLEQAAKNLEKLIERYNPRYVGMEKAVFFKNVASSMVLSELRGVLRLVLYQNLDQMDLRLFELSPTAVKKTASGLGLASKSTVLKALQLRFEGMNKIPDIQNLSFDAFDALAIAYTTWRESLRQGALSHRSLREGPHA